MSLFDGGCWQQKFVTVLGRQVSYLHHQAEFLSEPKTNPKAKLDNRPSLVFIHGWLDNAASFERLVPYLKQYDIYLIELSGHGQSDHIGEDAHYHLIDWVYEFNLVIKQLALSDFYLIGHSLGGIVSSMYSVIAEGSVKKLILLESVGAFVLPNNNMVENLKQAFNSREQLSHKTKPTEKNKLRPIPLLASLVDSRARAGEFSQDIAELLVERNIERVDGVRHDKQAQAESFIWRSDPRLKTLSPIRLNEAQAVELIKQVKVACLVILGSNGFNSIAGDLKRRGQYVENLTTQFVEGGHHFHLEQPEQTAAHIKAFIA